MPINRQNKQTQPVRLTRGAEASRRSKLPTCGKVMIADFRADEGLRIRENGLCPCLHDIQGGWITNIPIVILIDEDTERNE